MASGLEIAAGAIGIIGVSQQVVQTAFKARTFCKEVKDAPTELRELTQSLETLSRILIRLRETIPPETWNSQLGPSNVDILQASLQACHDDAARISILISDAHRMLEKKRFRGSCTLVSKKREIHSMLEKLNRSKADLSLAYSIYASSNIMDCAVSRAPASQMHGEALLENDTSRCSASQRLDLRRSRIDAASSRSMSLRLSLPRMLCKTAWEIALLQAAGQWTLSLKTYRVLDVNSPAIDMCYRGNLTGIRQMLESRALSVRDQSADGYPLYSYAALNGHFELTSYLLAHGAERTYLPQLIHYHPWRTFHYLWGLRSDKDLPQARKHAQLLLEDWQGDPSDILTAIAKSPHSWTSEDWFAMLSTRFFLNRPGVLQKMMGATRIDPARFPTPAAGSAGVLHVLAGHAALEICFPREYPCFTLDWLLQVQSFVKDGADPSLEDKDGYTPFMIFIVTLSAGITSLTSSIHHWTYAMLMAGIDLQAYGELEQRAWKACKEFQDLLYSVGIIGFLFGARPDQWHLWYRQAGDLYAAMFWQSIEHPEYSMPGAWSHQEDTLLPELEFWSTLPRCRPHGVKRKKLRRLYSCIRHDATVSVAGAVAALSAVEELKTLLVRLGDYHKSGSAVSQDMRNRMRDLMYDLGLQGDCSNLRRCEPDALPAPETLQWF